MQDQGARKRSEKRERAPLAPSHTKRDRTRSKGPGDSCESPALFPLPCPRLSLSPHTLLLLSRQCIYSSSEAHSEPLLCARPAPEEGCCDEDGSLSHAGRSSLLSQRGSHGDEEQRRSVGVRMGETCPERKGGSHVEFRPKRLRGQLQRVGCGCWEQTGRAEAMITSWSWEGRGTTSGHPCHWGPGEWWQQQRDRYKRSSSDGSMGSGDDSWRHGHRTVSLNFLIQKC